MMLPPPVASRDRTNGAGNHSCVSGGNCMSWPPVWVANVNVHDRSTCSGSIQAGLRDFFGRDRQRRILIGVGQVAGDGASEDGFHRLLLTRMLQSYAAIGSPVMGGSWRRQRC